MTSDFTFFLSSLFEDGHVRVPELAPVSDEEKEEGSKFLTEYEAQYRLSLIAKTPLFDVTIAQQAAFLFYRACQFTVARDAPAEMIAVELNDMQQFPNTQETHYSVDLVFRFLPDLYRLSITMAKDDPLVMHLQGWAMRWCLSSVGIKDLSAPFDTSGFDNSPALLGIYRDRILATNDLSRIDTPQIQSLVEAAWGMYPELATTVSNHIKSSSDISLK